MQHAIEYLKQHPEVLTKVENGEACLLGVSEKQQSILIEAFRSGWSTLVKKSIW